MDVADFNDFSQYLDGFSPANRRKALREIAQYLMRSNRKRLKANLQPSGGAMKARQHGSRKMFQKMGKSLKQTVRSDEANIGYFDSAGKIATNHQLGKTLNRKLSSGRTLQIELPVRELLGLDDEDQAAVHAIFVKHLMPAF